MTKKRFGEEVVICGTDVMILKIFSPKNIAKNCWGF
jgi:hypothetical protein